MKTDPKVRFPPVVAAILMVSFACGSATGQEPDARAYKRGFTLFDPTPGELMRQMSTDRPDTTESPYTVDAGHFQFELSLIEFTHNKDDGVRTDALSVLPSTIKIGLLNSLDIQFVYTPYRRITAKAGRAKDLAEGFRDDTQIRLKFNLWGNDGGDTALAFMPFIKFPTGSDVMTNGRVEGGLCFPMALSLPHDFSLGLMAKVDFVYNEASGGYGLHFIHTATLGHQLIGNLNGYIEYIGIAPYDAGGTYQAIASSGLTYALTHNWVLDCGGTIGLSDSADDFTLFLGTSFRF